METEKLVTNYYPNPMRTSKEIIEKLIDCKEERKKNDTFPENCPFGYTDCGYCTCPETLKWVLGKDL